MEDLSQEDKEMLNNKPLHFIMCFSLNHICNSQYLQDQETGHLCSGDERQPTGPSISSPVHTTSLHLAWISTCTWTPYACSRVLCNVLSPSRSLETPYLYSFCQQTQLIKVDKSYLQKAAVNFHFNSIIKIEIKNILPNLGPSTTVFFPIQVEKLNRSAPSAWRSRWSEQYLIFFEFANSFPGS